jgi:hypothetical protein
MHRLIACILTLIALLNASAAQAAAEPPSEIELVERSDDNLLVVEVRYRSLTLSDSFMCYLGDAGQVLVPLGDLARLLELPIEVEPLTGQASGWFLAEDRRFLLDIARQEVVVEGRILPLAPGDAEAHRDGIFVDAAALSKWLPIDIHIFQSQLLLRIDAREPLPMDSRLERKARWDQLQQRQAIEKGEPVTLQPAWLRWPGLDNATTVRTRRQDGGATADVDQTLIVRGDALHGSAEIFAKLNGSEGQFEQDIRAFIEYRDDESLVEGLKLRRVQLGHFNTMAAPLISRGEPALGVAWGSEAGEYAREAHRIDIRGEHLPGWAAELSRNGVLLDAMMIGDDGRYQFSGVPLVFGMNRFVIVLRGPFGERVERVETYTIGAEMLAPGRWSYDGGIYRRAVSQACCTQGGELGLWSGTAGGMYGISDQLSMAARISVEPRRGGHHVYVLSSIHAGYVGGIEQLTVIKDLNGGWGFRLGVVRPVLGQDLQFEQDMLLGYESAASPGEGGTPEQGVATRVSSSGRLFGLVYRIGYEDMRLRTQEKGAVNGRISLLTGAVTTALGFQAEVFPTREATMDLQADAVMGDFSMRGRLQMPIEPLTKQVLLSSSVNWKAPFGFDLRVQGQADIRPEVFGWQIGGGAQADLGVGHLGLQVDGGEDEINAQLTFKFSMQEDVAAGGVFIDSQPVTNQATVMARIFLDNDHDGVFGLDDTPIEGATVRVNGVSVPASDKGGVIRWRSAAWRTSQVEVDRASLVDPYWTAPRERFEVTARPGTVSFIDIPIVIMGEVDGVVEVSVGERRAGVGDVTLQLVDATGRVVAETQSSHDGFFLFEGLLPGHFTLRPEPSALDKHGLSAAAVPSIELKSGDVLSNQHIVLSPLQPN